MSHERKVGAVVAIGLALLLGGVFLIGKVRLGVSGYYVTAKFKFVNNLRLDAPVKYAGGLVIGRVREIRMDEDLLAVRVWIDRRYRIREDCELWIFTTGMLGEQYIEVNASPSGTAPFVKEGSVLRGIDPISVDATLIRLGKIIDALTPIFGKEEVAASVHSMVADLKSVTAKIAKIVDAHVGKMDQALTDLEAFSRSMGRLAADFELLMANLKLLTDAKSPDSVRAAVVKVNAALDDLKSAARTADALMTRLDQGKGLMGALINDEQLKLDVQALIKKLKDQPITAKVRLF